MDFGKIIARSWEIVKTHRYLWWLGALAGIAGGGSFSNVISSFDDSPDSSKQKNYQDLANNLTESQIYHALHQAWPYIVVIVGTIILLTILFIYLCNSSRAGLIRATNDLEDGKEPHNKPFFDYFQKGKNFVWRLFGLDLFITLTVIGFFIIISLPLTLSLIFKAGTGAYILSGIIIILGFLAAIALAFYLSIVTQYASRILVLKNYPIVKSFKLAQKLARNQLQNSLLALIITIGLSLAFGLAIGISCLIAGGILFGLGYTIYMIANLTAAIIYGVIAGLAFLAALIFANGIFTAFISSFWTITYRAINYLSTHKEEHGTK